MDGEGERNTAEKRLCARAKSQESGIFKGTSLGKSPLCYDSTCIPLEEYKTLTRGLVTPQSWKHQSK